MSTPQFMGTYGAGQPPVGNATIDVDGELLRKLGEEVGGSKASPEGYVAMLSSDVSMIFTTLEQLKLGWAGKTQQEAEEFFNRLNACISHMFGNSKNEDSVRNSVLARVASALQLAGTNYLAAEDAVVKEFNDFAAQMNGEGGGGQSSITDPKETAISETYG
ncbi:hypothetical protein ACFU99_37380 [Streptomyces sp. NPDC057654]|uniref:hypothetical protein n=1 Tax=Streptomyces sp. NPDC057654 TaxID=3346196 RepID=UPI003690ECD1